jgi:hypothetical protein
VGRFDQLLARVEIFLSLDEYLCLLAQVFFALTKFTIEIRKPPLAIIQLDPRRRDGFRFSFALLLPRRLRPLQFGTELIDFDPLLPGVLRRVTVGLPLLVERLGKMVELLGDLAFQKRALLATSSSEGQRTSPQLTECPGRSGR